MKAIAIERFGGPEQMKEIDVPVPQPAKNEVLIKIHYAAVNPVDWKIREGWLKKRIPCQFPLVLGWDAAGTIEAVGDDAHLFSEGDEVYAYCRKPVLNWGTFCEYITMNQEFVALKPNNISFAEAASMPLTGLTAWQSIFEFAELQEGQSILIHAGAGGVGSLAIQLAKHAKAHVITTASEEKAVYVKELGADVIIDYKKDDFVTKIRDLYPNGVDVVYDCVGDETLEKSWNCIRTGGTLVTIVDFNIDMARAEEMGIRAGFVFVAPNGGQLKQIADLIENGNLKPPMIQEFDLEGAAAALEQIREGHTQGKIVLKVL